MQSAITKLAGHSYSKRFNANITICAMNYNNVRQLPKTISSKGNRRSLQHQLLEISQPDCALYYY
jgi:hypothetical protein